MDSICTHKIIILQALGEGDLKTGTKLEEDIDSFICALEIKTKVELKNLSSKKEFIIELNDIKYNIEKESEIPLLHIEAHGSSDKKGIVFPNGDFMSWEDLKPILTEINVKTRFNLFVVFAMCNGANFLDTVKIGERCPFECMIGPIKNIEQRPLLSTFSRFYQNIFRGNDLVEAVKDINLMQDNRKTPYLLITADLLFSQVMEKIELDDTYAKELYRKAKRDNIVPRQSVGSIKRMIKREWPTMIDTIRSEYYMLDIFPENKSRFEP